MASGETDLNQLDDISEAPFAAAADAVDALNQAGRWPEALAAASALFERHRNRPRACTVLADTLLALGLSEQAEAVLRDARTRFPAETSFAVRLAELAAVRRDWPECLTLWRAAGQPNVAAPAHLRAYALALASSGEATAALRLVTQPDRKLPEQRLLLLAEAELLLRQGRIAEAAALYPAMAWVFTLADAAFAEVAGQLAIRADDAAAKPILAALLTEADPGGADWIPAIGRALMTIAPGDARHERIIAALKANPVADGLAAAVAAGLAENTPDSDVLAARLARGVADGRLGLLPLLLETAGSPVRAARLRIALRLAINRSFADPASFAALDAASVCALLLAARVGDADCLDYFAELARPRFARPAPGELARPEDVAGQVAHIAGTHWPKPVRLQRRLRVAVCVYGRMPSLQPATGIVRALRLTAHDSMVFAHVWRTTGGNTAPPGLPQVLKRLPQRLGAAFAGAAGAGGYVGLRRLYPALLQGRPLHEVVDVATVSRILHTEYVVVADDAAQALAGRDAQWKARSSARQAHLMADAIGEGFDLYVHLPADAGALATADIDWVAMAQRAQSNNMMFAETGFEFHRAAGFTLGDRFAAGSRKVMGLAADSFALGEQAALGRRPVYGLQPAQAMARSLAMQLHLNGISAEPVPELAFGVPPDLDPISPTAALALLWQDIRARRPAPPDNALVRAAMADVTGGTGL